jgi:hypothetical protein
MTLRFWSLRASLSLFLLAFVEMNAVAGGIDRFAFSTAGKRVDLLSSQVSTNELVFVEAKIQQTCLSDSNKVCVHWDLVLNDSANEIIYSGRLKDALSIWSSDPNLKIAFHYGGVIPANPLPGPADEFGNETYDGNFLVSFVPPKDILFAPNEVSTTRRYVKPNLQTKTGEIKWAGIYFNPSYKPERDYDLRSALLHEIGRALGLSPSAVPPSVMYPVRIASGPKNSLHFDDLVWAGTKYGTDTFLKKSGSLSGRFLSGKDGSAVVGAHIQALSADKIQAFSQSQNRDLFLSGSFSKEEGRFIFPILPPGDYVLLGESAYQTPASLPLLDDWLRKYSSSEVFETEFYDGKGRESNQEPMYAFSPQSIFYAARVSVQATVETTGVTFISNVADPKIPLIEAPGSSAEKLSGVASPQQQEASKMPDTSAQPAADSSSGGCALNASQSNPETWFSLLPLAFALFLLVPIRQGQTRG